MHIEFLRLPFLIELTFFIHELFSLFFLLFKLLFIFYEETENCITQKKPLTAKRGRQWQTQPTDGFRFQNSNLGHISVKRVLSLLD